MCRVLCDVKPTLAPSYRILFENVDKTVDTGGYPNRHPVHLKCLAISGLPVDEIPCVEVWDMHGLVFNSHAGWKSTNKCTWSSEYGDGFFRVSHDILGDFSVMCRFGGHHALTRDKTTLIFKYQNNTGTCSTNHQKHPTLCVNTIHIPHRSVFAVRSGGIEASERGHQPGIQRLPRC